MKLIKIGERFINLDMLVSASKGQGDQLVLTMAVSHQLASPDGKLMALSITLLGAEAAAVAGYLATLGLDITPGVEPGFIPIGD